MPPAPNLRPEKPAKPRRVSLIAIPGLGGSYCRYATVRQHLPKTVKLTTVELPGFGELEAEPAAQSLKGLANFVLHHVHAQPPPRILLGHGLGGSIALEFAQYFAGEIDGLIVHAPALTQLAPVPLTNWLQDWTTRNWLQEALSRSWLQPFFSRRVFVLPYRELVRTFDEDLEDFYYELAVSELFPEAFDWIHPEWLALLKPISLPAQVWSGSKDRIRPTKSLEPLREILTRAEWTFYPEWGHYPMLEMPDQYAEALVAASRSLMESRQAAHSP